MSIFFLNCSDDDDPVRGTIQGEITDAITGNPIESANVYTETGSNSVTSDSFGDL